jgi:hypothetical protein
LILRRGVPDAGAFKALILGQRGQWVPARVDIFAKRKGSLMRLEGSVARSAINKVEKRRTGLTGCGCPDRG